MVLHFVQRWWPTINRLAGGRYANYKVPPEHVAHPKTRRAFRAIGWLLLAEVAVGIAALVFAIINRHNHVLVPFSVWFRSVVVLGITFTLFVFTEIAKQGYYWGYSRLRLFSQIFPVITFILAAIPGLYPTWMVFEQIVFSVLMIGIADYLTSDHMRWAFPRPTQYDHGHD